MNAVIAAVALFAAVVETDGGIKISTENWTGEAKEAVGKAELDAAVRRAFNGSTLVDSDWKADIEKRLAACEKWIQEKKDAEAQEEFDRKERERQAEERQKARAKYDDEIRAFDRWLKKERDKYGRMTLVGFDTNTNERIYRRADGYEVRYKMPFDPSGREVNAAEGGKKTPRRAMSVRAIKAAQDRKARTKKAQEKKGAK